jgi:hypothetical protein
MKSWKDNNILLREAQPSITGQRIRLQDIEDYGREHGWKYRNEDELYTVAQTIRSMFISETSYLKEEGIYKDGDGEYPSIDAMLSPSNIEDLFSLRANHAERDLEKNMGREVTDCIERGDAGTEEEARECVRAYLEDSLQRTAFKLNRVCGCRITY